MAKIKVDFSGVTDSNFDVVPGKYNAKVREITQDKGKSGYPYLRWKLVILNGASKGSYIDHITTLKPEGLFNLRNTLIACGLDVPKSAVSFDPAALKGKVFGIEVIQPEDSDYPQIKKVFQVKDEEEEEEEYEEEEEEYEEEQATDGADIEL